MAEIEEALRVLLREVTSELLPEIRRIVREELAALHPRRGWMTVVDAAKVSRRSPDTVRNAIKAGRLKGSKSTGSREWRIEERDLATWMQPKARHTGIDMDAEVAKALARFRQRG